MDDNLPPLCASTPKKAKLDDTSYLFIDEDTSAVTTDSELLFPSEAEDNIYIQDSIASGSSLLFLDDTVDDTVNDTVTSLDINNEREVSEGKKECCKENCLHSFSVEEFDAATKHFKEKSAAEQRQFLLDSLIFSSPSSASVREKFMLYSKAVCRKGFANLLGTSERRLERIKQHCGASVKIVHGNRGMKRPTIKSCDAPAWMKSYFDMMGDNMPDSNRIHLPSFMTKREVYQKCVPIYHVMVFKRSFSVNLLSIVG